LAFAWPFGDDDGICRSVGSSSDVCVLHCLVDPFSLTKRRDMGQLHDRMAQDLVLRNFRPASRWRAVREAVMVWG
jgi:hypothetical protein